MSKLKAILCIFLSISLLCLVSCEQLSLDQDEIQALAAKAEPVSDQDYNAETYKQMASLTNKIMEFSQTFNRGLDPVELASPFSLYLALASLEPGLEGPAADQLAAAIIPSDLSREEFRQTLHLLLSEDLAMDQPPVYQANNLTIGSREQSFNPDYLDRLGKLGFQACQLDFSRPKSFQALNRYIKDQTHGLIDPFFTDQAIDQMCKQSDLRLILLNTLYFAGKWDQAFDQAKPASFYGLEQTSQVSLMEQTARLSMAEKDGIRYLRIPYSNRAYLTIALPDQVDQASQLKAALDQVLDPREKLDWQTYEVKLKLPEFSLENQLELNDSLALFGLESFAHEIDRAEIFTDPESVFIKKIIQKLKLEVDQTGTIAAAATAISVDTCQAPADPPLEVDFRVDHPFAYLISYDSLPLFQGVVTDLPNIG